MKSQLLSIFIYDFTLSSLNQTEATFAGAFKKNGWPIADKICPKYKNKRFVLINVLVKAPEIVVKAEIKI